MNNRQTAAVTIVFFLSVATLTAALLECPECTNMVSERALMCPKCGAPIDFIKEVASKKSQSPARDWRTAAIKVQTDVQAGYGIGVKDGTNSFILFDQRLIEGAQSLTCSTTISNKSVAYFGLELADDSDLARVSTTDTNLLHLTLATAVEPLEPAFAIYSVATNGYVQTNTISPSSDSKTALEVRKDRVLLCLCNAKTNVVALPQAGGELMTIPPQRWVPAEPLQFRKQTILLKQAEDALATGVQNHKRLSELTQAIASTTWITKNLQNRATSLRHRLEPQQQSTNPQN